MITGCAGFTGSYLSARLIDEGWSISGIDSFTPTGKELEIAHEQPALGDPERTGGDTTRIEADLGWKSSVSLRGGLAEQVAWFRDA